MKVLVTGATGFIGSRLLHDLNNRGLDVVGASRSSSPPQELRKIPWRVVNWADEQSVTQACLGINTVIHLAGVDAATCLSNPHLAAAINVENTSMLARVAREEGVARFIFASTIHVYSQNMTGIIDEGSPTSNTHPYAAAKIVAENNLRSFAARSEFELVILRLSNVYGVPVLKNPVELVIHDLCRQAAVSQTLSVHSTTDLWRNFIAMPDVTEVIFQILLARDVPQLVNVGHKSLRLSQIAKLIGERWSHLTQEKAQVYTNFASSAPDLKNLVFVCNFLEKEGIKPRNFNAEIDRLIDYSRTNYTAASEFAAE